MNVLILGTGKGSWQIRGKQLGAAIGARVTAHPSGNDFSWADVIVLVKHAAERWGRESRATKAKVVWDVLDWWAQPEQNQISLADAVADIHRIRQQFGIDLLIGATKRMAEDIGGVYLPHHSRPGLRPQPARRVQVVAYEGTPKYLGSWRRHLSVACAERGLTFVINPPDLGVADLVVAFRGEQWDGEICRQWKSGVKYVNAVAAGRPVITQYHAALEEIGALAWTAETPLELGRAFDHCLTYDAEDYAATSRMLADRYTLDAVSANYRTLLERVMRRAA